MAALVPGTPAPASTSALDGLAADTVGALFTAMMVTRSLTTGIEDVPPMLHANVRGVVTGLLEVESYWMARRSLWAAVADAAPPVPISLNEYAPLAVML